MVNPTQFRLKLSGKQTENIQTELTTSSPSYGSRSLQEINKTLPSLYTVTCKTMTGKQKYFILFSFKMHDHVFIHS